MLHSSLVRVRLVPIAFTLTCILPSLKAQTFTTFVEWAVPTPVGEPREFALSGDNGAYFSEPNGSKIGFLDMNKSVITEWTLPPYSAPPATG